MYTIDYFIAKFEAIPTENIIDGCQGMGDGIGCAYGQCKTLGSYLSGDLTDEGRALKQLMMTIPNMTPINDNVPPPYKHTPARINNGQIVQYQQPTPKERILAALYDIKAMQMAENQVNIIINKPMIKAEEAEFELV